MPLMRFIVLNWDIHKYPRRVNEIHSPVLLRFQSMKGLGHTHKYSSPFTHSFQPQAKLAANVSETLQALIRFVGSITVREIRVN